MRQTTGTMLKLHIGTIPPQNSQNSTSVIAENRVSAVSELQSRNTSRHQYSTHYNDCHVECLLDKIILVLCVHIIVLCSSTRVAVEKNSLLWAQEVAEIFNPSMWNISIGKHPILAIDGASQSQLCCTYHCLQYAQNKNLNITCCSMKFLKCRHTPIRKKKSAFFMLYENSLVTNHLLYYDP